MKRLILICVLVLLYSSCKAEQPLSIASNIPEAKILNYQLRGADSDFFKGKLGIIKGKNYYNDVEEYIVFEVSKVAQKSRVQMSVDYYDHVCNIDEGVGFRVSLSDYPNDAKFSVASEKCIKVFLYRYENDKINVEDHWVLKIEK